MIQQLTLNIAIEQIRQHGLWFIDIPRTSSSSIRAELGKLYGSPYGKTNLTEKEHSSSQIFQDHTPAKVMREQMHPEVWDKLFTFSVVRNPWDRMVSLYNHRRKVQGIPANINFRDYVIELGKKDWGVPGAFFYHGHYLSSSDYICDNKGRILVKFVGKFENRAQDISIIAKKIRVKEFGTLAIQKASPPDLHYSVYYDNDTKAIIERLYEKDIELFDYCFQESA